MYIRMIRGRIVLSCPNTAEEMQTSNEFTARTKPFGVKNYWSLSESSERRSINFVRG